MSEAKLWIWASCLPKDRGQSYNESKTINQESVTNFGGGRYCFRYCSWPLVQQKNQHLISWDCIILCFDDSSKITMSSSREGRRLMVKSCCLYWCTGCSSLSFKHLNMIWKDNSTTSKNKNHRFGLDLRFILERSVVWQKKEEQNRIKL